MKLTDLDIIVTAPPAPGWGGRYWILVKLTTDDGITGWGECYASSVGPDAMRAVIADVFERHMAGESPENVELMYRRAYSAGFTQRPDLTVMGAFSGLEIACWDILGKARGRPVWAMLGGLMNDRVRAYTYLYPLPQHPLPEFWVDAGMAGEAAADCVARGYTAVKFDPAGPYTIRGGHQPAMRDLSRSVEFCAAIREAVGDRADLLFGTHGQFTPSGAVRMGQAIAPYQPLWFEEPVPPDDMEGLARVAAGQPVPVATGERLTTTVEFGAALRAGASILQPALGRAGGLWQARKIAALAEAHGCPDGPAPIRRSGGMGREHPSRRLYPEHPDRRDDRDGFPQRPDPGQHPGGRRLCSPARGAGAWDRGGRRSGARASLRRNGPSSGDAGGTLRLRGRECLRRRSTGTRGRLSHLRRQNEKGR